MGQDNGSAQQGKWDIDFGGGTGRSSFGIGYNSGVAAGAFGISLPYEQYGLFELHMDGSSFEGYFAGRLSGSDTNVAPVVPVDLARPLTIGYWETIYEWGRPLASSGFCGDIAEILIYNSATSDAQRQEVGGYLGEKYNLPSEYAPFVPTLRVEGRPTNGQLQVRINGTAGRSYTLQYSLNLTNWLPLLTTNAPGNSFTVTDPGATNGARFYRAVTEP